jgi:hypothetical protein
MRMRGIPMAKGHSPRHVDIILGAMLGRTYDQRCRLQRMAIDGVRAEGRHAGARRDPRERAGPGAGRWAKPARGNEKCWVSAESAADLPIIYAEGELAFWMPLPTNVPRMRSGAIASSKLPQVPGEIEGSGI